MNTCIGASNLRFFLAFLALNCVLCTYGAAVVAALIVGEVRHKAVLDAVVAADEGEGGSVSVRQRPMLLLPWILQHFGHLLTLLALLLVALAMLSSFLAFHMYLVSSNTTTNEFYKRKDLDRATRKLAAEKELEAAAARGEEAPASATEGRRGGGVVRFFFCRRRSRQKVTAAFDPSGSGEGLRNFYDRGSWAANWLEVMAPEWWGGPRG